LTLDDYILEHIDEEGEYLHRLYRATHLKLLYGRMASGHLQGRLLKMFVRMIRPKNILEIGTYSGYESDEIVIDGVTYVEDYANDYSASDKGHYLGSVVYIKNDQEKDPKFVWDIKGTDEYIYVLFAYDGTIYKKAG
jgi:hypothetical protein